jgi:HlyD family secretion protein
VLRIDLEPGDFVKRGAIVARIRPEPSPLLDARTRAEAQAAVETARAALGRARAEEQRARAALALAQREHKRLVELAGGGLTTQQQLDAGAANVQTSQEAVEAASFAVRAAEGELRGAQVRLDPAPVEASERVVTVAAPADGVVLRRVRESEAVVPAGDPLLELGDPDRIEIVSDFLSTDAVKVRPGARAIIDQWGGPGTLDARVRLVEPSGFTKVSALGVEEQRVNVILDFVDLPSAALSALGDAYRVEVAVVVWEAEDVLKIPTSALFRRGDDWAVYVVEDGRARTRTVTLGQRTGQEAEVTNGVAEGQPVVLHPGDTLQDGTRVEIAAQ